MTHQASTTQPNRWLRAVMVVGGLLVLMWVLMLQLLRLVPLPFLLS